MIYDYQYSIVAVIATVVLMVLIYQRRGYFTARNRVFIQLVYINLILILVDTFTFYTISYPERYPVPVLYISNMLYVIMFGVMTGSYFRYVASMIDDARYRRTANRAFLIIIAIEAWLTVTTYWTNLIFYYDDEMVYRHGPLFIIMYVFPVIMLVMIIGAFLVKRSNFSRLHKQMVIGLAVFGACMSAVQVLFPKFDIFSFSNAIILFIIYIIFENPAYYTYHSTRCFNYRAMYEECNRLRAKNNNPEMVLLGIFNHPTNHGIQEMAVFNKMYDILAERLFTSFGYKLFCIADGKYIIIAGSGWKRNESQKILEKLRVTLSAPVEIGDIKFAIDYKTRVFYFQDMAISDDFIDHLIEGFQQTPLERLFFVDDLSRIILEQHEYREIEDVLSYAVKANKFTVNYQPIYHLRTGRIRSAEALMRLTDMSGRNISPSMIVPIAEKNGNIVEIGELIFDKVCCFWKENDLEAIGLEYIEINISPIQLNQKDMASRFIEIMEKYGVNPSHINLEIVETSFDAGYKNVEHNLSILKKYGVHFSIDDYGSGFASVDYLYRFPISLVKIDKSILWQSMKNSDALKVFHSTLDLVNSMDKGIVVEGAENEEMVEVIREAGAHYIQGYYYSKPLPGEEFIKFVKDWNAKSGL